MRQQGGRRGPKCRACLHRDRPAIDRALVDGEAVPAIARSYELEDYTVYRHRRSHLRESLVRAASDRADRQAATLQEQVRGILEQARGILNHAEASGDYGTALTAIREVRGTLDLLGRVTGELTSGTSVTVVNQLGVTVAEAKAAVDVAQRAGSLSSAAIMERAGQCLKAGIEAREPVALRVVGDLARLQPSGNWAADGI